MEMIPHNAEIFYLERVPLFSPANNLEKHFLHHPGRELLFLSVDATGDMVAGAFPQLAWMSHMVYLRAI